MINPPGMMSESVGPSPAASVRPFDTVKVPRMVPPPGNESVVTPFATASLFTTVPAGAMTEVPVEPKVVIPVL